MSWDQLAAADPEVIVIMPCGWDPARTEPEMHWLTDRPEWPRLRAVRNGRVHLTDGNHTSTALGRGWLSPWRFCRASYTKT